MKTLEMIGDSMHFALKNMLPKVAVSLVALTTLAHADTAADTMFAYTDSGKTRSDDTTPPKVINPSARPMTPHKNWMLSGEALYWNAHEEGLEYAVQDDAYVTATSSFRNAEFLRPKFRWDWGFRIGLGYVIDRDGWDICAKWTHFYTRSKGTSSCCGQSADLFPLLSNLPLASPTSAGAANLIADGGAVAHWRLRLDLLDLECGREFMTSKWLSLRPHVGLRGAWIRQTYKVTYSGGFENTTSFSSFETDEADFKNNFKGGGVRAGLDSKWGLTEDFSIYGNLAISLIYGRFKVQDQEVAVTASSTIPTPIINWMSAFHSSKAITDLALGVRYDHFFQDSGFGLCLAVSWEHHMFFNQNQLWQAPRTGSETVFAQRHGDLSTQGWTFSAGIAF